MNETGYTSQWHGSGPAPTGQAAVLRGCKRSAGPANGGRLRSGPIAGPAGPGTDRKEG
jgi:hypothetical protein